MNNTIILFYSKKCIHSQKFLSQLYKNQELYNSIYKISIEEPKVKIPRNITSVPTIVIKNNHNFITYIGDEVFDWFRSISVNTFNKKYDTNTSNTSNNTPPPDQHKVKQSDKVVANFQPTSGNTVTKKDNSSIQCYDPIAMSGGFSDSFSSITDTTPMGHCYEFIHGDNKIKTANSSYGENKTDKEDKLNNEYEKMLENRNSDQHIRKQIQRQ